MARNRIRRRGVATAAAALAVPALLVAVTGTAYADKPDPRNPYAWDCGSSRSGGVYAEAYAETITVDLFTRDGDRRLVFHGRVAQNIDGGSKGTAQIFVSNDGNVSTVSRGYCDARP